MKPYLIDVPVKVNIWIRPNCQYQQFEVIKKVRPSILFIQSDGGRNEYEWEMIRNHRIMIEEGIDWECTVYKLYNDKNCGLYTTGLKMRELVWSHVDRCIFLEDDQLPTVSYFQFCAELLEKYKDDTRIECICGFNHLGKYDCGNADYFFSRQGSIWGTASWKRVAEESGNYDYINDSYVMKLLKQRTRRNKIIYKRLCAYGKQDYYEGHVAGTEFLYEFDMYSQNRLQIIPKVNLLSNIGCTEESEHADNIKLLPKGIRSVFNSVTYEMKFPMKHPSFVIPDIEYEKRRNRIMGYNHPIVNFYRKFERLCRKILAGDIKYIINKLKVKKEN